MLKKKEYPILKDPTLQLLRALWEADVLTYEQMQKVMDSFERQTYEAKK